MSFNGDPQACACLDPAGGHTSRRTPAGHHPLTGEYIKGQNAIGARAFSPAAFRQEPGWKPDGRDRSAGFP